MKIKRIPQSRWDVYEYMKSTYMFGGRIPTQSEVIEKFSGYLDKEEILEGVAEFALTVKRFAPHIQMEQVVGQ